MTECQFERTGCARIRRQCASNARAITVPAVAQVSLRGSMVTGLGGFAPATAPPPLARLWSADAALYRAPPSWSAISSAHRRHRGRELSGSPRNNEVGPHSGMRVRLGLTLVFAPMYKVKIKIIYEMKVIVVLLVCRRRNKIAGRAKSRQ